jgi:hypothetical protein
LDVSRSSKSSIKGRVESSFGKADLSFHFGFEVEELFGVQSLGRFSYGFQFRR